MIELHTLGTLALRNPGGEPLHSVLAQPKRVALLAYLAIARPRGFHRRDTLLALLWPEQDEQHARGALNQALRHLRTALGKETVPSRGDEEVGIDARAFSCDAVDFEAAIEADNPARALELYRGDLLTGFHVSACGEFERWLEEERVWLRRRAARAAAALARREEARGEPVAAGHWARRALALASDDEGEVRSLIELLGRLGDRAGAVQAYEEFAQRLRDEYEAEPAPETRAAIIAVRARQVGAQPSAAALSYQPPSSDAGVPSPEAAVVPSPRPPKPRRRKRSLALGLLVVIAAGGAIWGMRPWSTVPRPAALPGTTIAVMPFAYRGSPEFAYLAEGMIDLLSANLNGAGEIRTVDPVAVLAQIRHTGRDWLEPEQARNLAARLGAGVYVQGTVVETGGRLRISARLQSDEPDEGGDPVTVGGPSTQLFQLVDGLTAQLIAQQSGSPAAGLSRLAALTTDSLAALKLYLEGERYFRAGRTDFAIDVLDRAVRIDSSFALAHYRLAAAALRADRRALAEQAMQRALRHSHRLSDSDRRIIQAGDAFVHGRWAEAEHIYREILSQHPTYLEPTAALAALYFHGDREFGLKHSWLDAREWLERVLAIDPGVELALKNLSEIAARERRLEELDSLTDRLLQIGSPLSWFFRGQRAIAFGDTAGTARFMTVLRKGDDVEAMGGWTVFTTGDLRVGRRIWRLYTEPSHSRGLRVKAHLTLAKMEVMTGRWSAAKVELEAAAALDAATALEHRALLALWPLLVVPRSELLELRQSLLQWKAARGPRKGTSVTADHAPAHPYLRPYLLGLVSARLGDYAVALAHAVELERRAAASFAPAFIGDLGRALRAEVARARGRPEEALTILDSLEFWTEKPLDANGDSPFYAREREQFTRAELLHELGHEDEALQAYRVMADNLFHSGAPAHFRLAEIYERQGERQKAAEHYARFAELWKDCDPELRPLVEEARRRM